MKKTKKKATAKKKPAAKKRAPAKAKAKTKAKPKAKAKAKTSAKPKAASQKAKSSKGLSFTELFELKQKKIADEAQQPGWKESAAPVATIHDEQPKAQTNVRNGRTNGSGARHH